MLLAGSAALVVAAIGVAYPIWWSTRSLDRGNALLRKAMPSSGLSNDRCSSSASLSPAPVAKPGVLEIPSLSTTAPVVNGLSSSVLSAAAGHDPATPWPGQPGESVVEAHDVSYFANLSKVTRGTSIIWLTSCFRATFAVTSTEISEPGAILHPPTGSAGLALVTCYPTDALFFTSQRFVVMARLVSEVEGPQRLPTDEVALVDLHVRVPSGLRQQDLTLATNSLALGTMQLAGAPSRSFSIGPSPLQVEKSALTVFFAAQHAVSAHNERWWSDVATSKLPMPTSWPPFGVVDVTIDVDGSAVRSITFSSSNASAEVVPRQGVLYLARMS